MIKQNIDFEVKESDEQKKGRFDSMRKRLRLQYIGESKKDLQYYESNGKISRKITKFLANAQYIEWLENFIINAHEITQKNKREEAEKKYGNKIND